MRCNVEQASDMMPAIGPDTKKKKRQTKKKWQTSDVMPAMGSDTILKSQCSWASSRMA
jgi:hypothetical protein